MTLANAATHFGVTQCGQPAHLYRLRNQHGMEAVISDYGATLVSLFLPLQTGLLDVVLGYDTLSQYEQCQAYVGCTVGRYANRIGGALFSLGGQSYSLEKNLASHHLHGGFVGFGKCMWQLTQQSPQALTLCLTSTHGDAGYPGELQVRVRYWLADHNELGIEYSARTDRCTVVNLTNHSYYNLAGHQAAQRDGVLDHQLQLFASGYVPTDGDSIPYGHIDSVQNTAMDFQTITRVGARIDQACCQLQQAQGYDHCWVLEKGAEHRLAARVVEPNSGRCMTVLTTQPGVQFYTANHLGICVGKDAAIYDRRGAMCLETQHFPDSPNHANFPSTRLQPGEEYRQSTLLRFS